MSALLARIPDGVKRFIRDALEAAIAALGTLVLTVPTNIGEAKSEALIVSVAIGAAVIAVARREFLPLILNWISPAP